ncbi:MAG: hypothetical protein MO852_06035, partial [Candidatus Devosia euplotis]|nr:hypothetical protein [Candidatus Devosia euplotis]
LPACANWRPQRLRRRGSAEGAIGAYVSGVRTAVKRMPAGYRKSVVARDGCRRLGRHGRRDADCPRD